MYPLMTENANLDLASSFAAILAALAGSVGAVWTCPSGRQPICCEKYEPEGFSFGCVYREWLYVFDPVYNFLRDAGRA